MKYALVNQTLASLRKETTKDSALEDEDFYGARVEVLGEPKKDWYQIRTHYGYTGYVHGSELLFDENKVKVWDKMKKCTVWHSYADALSMPKVQGLHLISLTRGATVAILQEAIEGGWVKVGLCDGREGYMKEKFLGDFINSWHIEEEAILRKNIVSTAMAYLGTQYRWGGRSSLGIDCSGLCSTSYMLNGVIIYRDSAIVEGFPVHEIPYADMKPCDLMFFQGHMAMYIGNNKYIHSTGANCSDGVVINSLNPCDTDYREDLPKILKAVGSVF